MPEAFPSTVTGVAGQSGFTWSDGYASLPPQFGTRVGPTPVAAPRLIKFNASLAEELGLAAESVLPAALADVFSGNRVLPGTSPLATVYAGHQFGHFVPQLGDGRAVLLGEVTDRRGRLREVQLKGAGRTPYSRAGDGRAALGPVLREYVVSEAMHALGIPTTRALAVVSTGETVLREQGALPGAVLTRVAASHVRVGTFQYFAARGDVDSVRRLADHMIERQFPEIGPGAAGAGGGNKYVALLQAVVAAQARLIAAWMNVGFIHGVMNTDNMAVSGETIDYGPCAFMDSYDPATVFSSIDRQGRYAYANQPAAAQWNLARFAETLLSCIDSDADRAIELATAVINEFPARYEDHWLAGMRRKLGLFAEETGDLAMIRELLAILQHATADFTLTFRRLCAAAEGRAGDAAVEGMFTDAADIRAWMHGWRERMGREAAPASEHAAFMRLVNPAVIPRNHRVEAVIVAAVERADFGPFEELTQVLARPFEERAAYAAYTSPPLADQRVLQTFCGT